MCHAFLFIHEYCYCPGAWDRQMRPHKGFVLSLKHARYSTGERTGSMYSNVLQSNRSEFPHSSSLALHPSLPGSHTSAVGVWVGPPFKQVPRSSQMNTLFFPFILPAKEHHGREKCAPEELETPFPGRPPLLIPDLREALLRPWLCQWGRGKCDEMKKMWNVSGHLWISFRNKLN